jgi:hypothetical protein
MSRLFLFLIASFFVSGIAMAQFTPAPLDDCGTSSGHRLFIEYTQPDFGNITEVDRWCQGFIDQFQLTQGFRCDWTRTGSYGRYKYHGIFDFWVDYPGQPRFYFQPFCGGGGGGY